MAYAAAAHRFFTDRIPFEEDELVQFFGPAYRDYHARTVLPLLDTCRRKYFYV